MQTVYVKLPTPDTVQDFVERLGDLQGQFDLVHGRYILDARSLMGIFSLDLAQPLELRVHNDTKENMNALRPFLA